jgi:uncharacterized membrane protein
MFKSIKNSIQKAKTAFGGFAEGCQVTAGTPSARKSAPWARWIARTGACFLAVLAAYGATAQCHYTWERVPNPGPGTYCIGWAINNLGAVAGYIDTGGDTTRAFVWSRETGRVQLPLPTGIVDMGAYAINDSGHVAGSMWGAVPGWKGFVWDGQNYTVIDLPAWANRIYVAEINNSDQIVGTLLGGFGPVEPFIWQNGVFTDLADLTGAATAFGEAINELGATAGSAYDAAVNRHAWTISEKQAISWLPEPAGHSETIAEALNNNGVFAGIGVVEKPLHANGIVWTPWETYVIPPGTQVTHTHMSSVNDSGRAVGSYIGAGHDRPIVWQQGVVTELRPLVTPPLTSLKVGRAINRHGQILARDNLGTVVLNPVWIVGDLSGDCHVSIQDLAILLSNFGSPVGSFPPGDVDGDGQVGLTDLSLLLSHWGE